MFLEPWRSEYNSLVPRPSSLTSCHVTCDTRPSASLRVPNEAGRAGGEATEEVGGLIIHHGLIIRTIRYLQRALGNCSYMYMFLGGDIMNACC